MELKVVIIYRSKHHGNTKKLVDALVEAHPEIDVIDVAALGKNEYPDLSPYHLIVMGSGIYYGNLDKDLLRVADHCLRDGDKVVGLMTYGGQAKFNGRDLDGVCRAKFATLLCMYGCPGFDTYGPFKLMGGMNKGRPNQEDIEGVVEFFDRVIEDYTEPILQDRARRDKQDAFNAAHPAGGLMSDIKRSVNKIRNRRKKKAEEKAQASAEASEQEAGQASRQTETASPNEIQPQPHVDATADRDAEVQVEKE